MTRHHAISLLRSRRGGTTLVEVLMSLLIMGIGVAAVAALFPASVLRSARATQQTTATALRYSVEGMLDASALDPDYDTGKPGCNTAAFALDPDGDRDPQRITSGPGLFYTPEKYVVDPLGYWRLRQQGQTHPQASTIGTWPAVDGGAAREPIPRFGAFKHLDFGYDPTAVGGNPDGNPLAIADWATLAEGFVGAPDHATNVADAYATYTGGATSSDPSTVTFSSADADFSQFAVSGVDLLSVTIFSADNRRSATQGVTGITSTASTWTLTLPRSLPAWATSIGTGRVLVEARESRYTWLLTIRNQPYNGGRSARIDVAVSFRRPFGPEYEQIYVVGREEVVDIVDYKRKVESQEYAVTWDPATQPRPDVSGGRWIFDPTNFRWYKVGNVGEERDDPDIAGNLRIAFRLEGVSQTSEEINRAMFLPDVVDVFPLTKQVFPLTDQ